MSEISSIDKEYKYLNSLIQDVYSNYSFVDEPLEFHYPHIINMLELETEHICNVNDDSSKTYFKDKVHNYFIDLVKKKINNPHFTYSIIDNYIKCNLKYQKKYSGLIKELEKLDDFFVKFECIPSPDLCIRLINKNLVIQQMIVDIVSKNMSFIQKNSLDSIFNNSTIELLVETYCVEHGIKVVDDVDDDINLYNFNQNQESLRYDDLSSEKMFFQEIRRLPLLTPKEERQLLVKYSETKNKRIRDILVERNMRLVAKIASKYVNKGLDFMDLIQEGSFGLIKAIDEFDVNRGTKLSTYATFWVRQTISRAVADKGRNIRIPVHVSDRLVAYERIVDSLSKELNRKPTLKEIAKAMNTTPYALEKLIKNTQNTFSINILIDEENSTEFGDLFVVDDTRIEDEMEKKELSEQLNLLFDKVGLSDREIDVLVRRFGLSGKPKQSLDSIGKIHNVSRERIRQIENTAIRKLGRSQHIRMFIDYADDPDKFIQQRTGKIKKREESENDMAKGLMTLKEHLNKGGFSYTDEQIAEMVSNLSEEDRGLLILRYTEGAKLNSDQTNKFYCTLIPKMKRMLENPGRVSKKKNSTASEVVKKETSVIEAESAIVQAKHDVRIEDAISVTLSNTQKINSEDIISSSDENCFSKDDYEKMLQLLRMPIFAGMLDRFTPKEAVIISLKLGYVDNKSFSTASIAKFLGIEEKEVASTTKKALLMCRDSFNSFIDMAIQETTGTPVKKIGSKRTSNC